MRILSIDPGFTTGIALYDNDEELEWSMAVMRKGLHRNGFLSHLVNIARPDIVLIEALPTNNVSSDMAAIHSHISQWFKIAGYRVEHIRPVEWKNLVTRVEIPGQHARDAATMALWWIKNKKSSVEGAVENKGILR